MLVLLGPGYGGSDKEVEVLAQETGLSVYDLRARLRPGAWGVIRAVADEGLALDLAERIRRRGLVSCAIDSALGQDPARKIVYLRGLRCDNKAITLRLFERSMVVPYGALLVVVRGEVHVGRSPHPTGAATAGALRASAGSVNLRATGPISQELYRDSRSLAEQDVFAAADIHFVTVPWIARIDARELDFPPDYVDLANLAERMDRCIDDVAAAAKIRVDREIRTSSLASHTVGNPRAATPLPGNSWSTRRGQGPTDEHFDAYSRMVAEAERQVRACD